MRRRRQGLLGAVVVAALASLVVAWALTADTSPAPRPHGSALDAGLQRHGVEVALGGGRAFPRDAGATGDPGSSGSGAPLAGDTAIAPPPPTFDAPPAPAAPPPLALRDPQFARVQPASGVWAVIIGINDYPGTRSDLRSAVNDANDVNEALARFGVPGDHRLLVTDRQASAGVVRATADWLVAHAASDATAVFFYAGHVRKLSSRTEAIVGADGQVVTDGDLAQRLSGLRARETWIGMAACYGGGFDELLGPGRILVAAADANHLAYENEGFGRSYMVQYMVRKAMIEGASPATVQSAFGWAKAAIDRDYPGRSPVAYDRSDGSVDVHQGGGAPPPPASSPTSPRSGGGSSGGGSSPGAGSSPPATDGCSRLTLGVVRCS